MTGEPFDAGGQVTHVHNRHTHANLTFCIEQRQKLEARVALLEDALRGIKWQAGSTPSTRVLGSIVRRAQEALDG